MIYNLFRRAHLDDEELSSFIDGAFNENDRARIIEHLKSCARCSESYREAVLYKGLWMSGVADLETSEESIELARQAVDRSEEREIGQVYKKPARIRIITVAASIVVIVALSLFYQFTNREDVQILDQSHLIRVREAVELASMNSHLVIPGGERYIDTVSEAYRSGYVRINDSLRAALAYFAGEFQEDKTDRAVVYWLLGGYISTGQVSAARDLASQALKEYPADIDIMIFDAIVSYMEGDITASEGTFREVLEREPDNAYANLNLAVLLSDRGDEFSALELLERVVDEQGDSPFAARARRIEEEIRESLDTDL
jgi:tetratricopeptide (TPR) repeat protein